MSEVVVWGVGELGAMFARGELCCGNTVVPVTRSTPLNTLAEHSCDPARVWMTMGVEDLWKALPSVPLHWRQRLVLVQNELLPPLWEFRRIEDPTVVSVWFEKKPRTPLREVGSSEVYGPLSEGVCDVFEMLSLPVTRLQGRDQLLRSLLVKNAYILVTNLVGMGTELTVEQLFSERGPLCRAVFGEVMKVQQHLLGENPKDVPSPEDVWSACLGRLQSCPDRKAAGRSARERCLRILETAKELDIEVPTVAGLLP